MENKVDFVEKLSTQKKRRKTAKVTYTPTYPHYPHEYCENYGAFIMVTWEQMFCEVMIKNGF